MQTLFALVAVVCTLLIAILALMRLRGTVDFSKNRSGLLVVGRRQFTLNGATGVVHHGPEGNQSVQSREARHVEFYLRDAHGHDHRFRLDNVDIAVAPGQRVSAGWVIEKGKERGPYLFFRNHSTKITAIVPSTVATMVDSKGKPWMLILLSIPAFMIPLMIYAVISVWVRSRRGKEIVQLVHTTWVPNAEAEARSLTLDSKAR